MNVIKKITATIDKEIESIVAIAIHEGITKCNRVTIKYCEPGIMYTLDCKDGRFKAVKSPSKDIEWLIHKMK